jgi:hypothetical protein
MYKVDSFSGRWSLELRWYRWDCWWQTLVTLRNGRNKKWSFTTQISQSGDIKALMCINLCMLDEIVRVDCELCGTSGHLHPCWFVANGNNVPLRFVCFCWFQIIGFLFISQATLTCLIYAQVELYVWHSLLLDLVSSRWSIFIPFNNKSIIKLWSQLHVIGKIGQDGCSLLRGR